VSQSDICKCQCGNRRAIFMTILDAQISKVVITIE
jgi:hypothetical protein